MKRTPLKRNTPLKSGGELKKTPLKFRSEKTQKLYTEERIPLVKRLLKERPWCEACPVFAAHDKVVKRVRPSVDLHEIKTRGRTGGVNSKEWLDETNILCVCRLCHDRIGDDPRLSKELGLLA